MYLAISCAHRGSTIWEKMKTTIRGVAATIAALAMFAGISAPQAAFAQGDWTWSAPENLLTAEFPYNSNLPDAPLVIDSQGRMMVMWTSVDGNFSRMAARTSLNGVDWTEPEYFTPANKDVSDAVLAADNSGRVTAMWLDNSGNDPTIWSTTFDGEAWLPAVRVTPNEGRYDNMALVADSTGLLSAVWDNGTTCSIESSRSTDGQTWATPVPVTTDLDRCPWEPQIVVDDSDRLTAIWNADDGQVTEYIVVEASTSTTPGSWGPVEVLSTVGEDARESTLVTTADGLAVAAWTSNQGTGPAIKSRSSQSGATWSPLESHGGESDVLPSLSAGPSGTVVLSWVAGEDGSDGLLVRSSNDGVSWTSPARISPEGDQLIDRARLSEDSCGQFVALWMATDEAQSTFFIHSSTSVNGVDWSSPINPDSAADLSMFPRIVEDAFGRVTAVWVSLNGATVLLQTSTMTKPACGSSPDTPVLANTGADAADITTTLAVSVGLLAVGAVMVATMRRRRPIL